MWASFEDYIERKIIDDIGEFFGEKYLGEKS